MRNDWKKNNNKFHRHTFFRTHVIATECIFTILCDPIFLAVLFFVVTAMRPPLVFICCNISEQICVDWSNGGFFFAYVHFLYRRRFLFGVANCLVIMFSSSQNCKAYQPQQAQHTENTTKNQQNNNPASQVTFTTNFVHLIFRLWAGMCSSSPAPKHFYFICEYSVNILLLICVLCVYWVIISSGSVTHVVISSQFICCCCCCYVRGACFSLAQIFPPLWTFFFLCRFFLYRFQQHSVALFFAVVAGDHVHF